MLQPTNLKQRQQAQHSRLIYIYIAHKKIAAGLIGLTNWRTETDRNSSNFLSLDHVVRAKCPMHLQLIYMRKFPLLVSDDNSGNISDPIRLAPLLPYNPHFCTAYPFLLGVPPSTHSDVTQTRYRQHTTDVQSLTCSLWVTGRCTLAAQ